MRPIRLLSSLLAAALVAAGPLAAPAATTTPQPSAAPTAGDPDFRVERLSGSDRYATAARVSARFHSPRVPVVYVAAGATFPDALSAGPAADRQGGPVLFVRRTDIPGSTAQELRRLQPRSIVVVGGSGVVDNRVVEALRGYTTGSVQRVSGTTRYDTALAVSRHAFPDGSDVVYVSTGADWPDALAAGAAAAVQDAPVLLTEPGSLPPAVAAEIDRLDPGRILLVGGSAAVAESVRRQLEGYAVTERVSGTNRYGTALAVSRRVFGPSRPGVVIATGTAFPDALAAVPATATTRGPVLLARHGGIPSGVGGDLDRLTPGTAYLMGGTSALSIDVARDVQRARGICWAGPTFSARESQKILSTVGGTDSKKMAFTLDMGGRLEGARGLVDYLVEEQVCTTFFSTSQMANTSEGRAVMARIAAHPELFEVGNHTVHHCDLVRGGGGSPSGEPCRRTMTDAVVRAEIADATPVLRDLTGMPVTPMWRPPYGSQDARVRGIAASEGFPVTAMWARDTIDWSPDTSAAEIVARTTSPLPASGSIVLAHIGGYHTAEALPQIVRTMRNNGYTMTTISDMRDG
ncbi:cell wall-binding repeat-containing protein [Serinicoccus kebangsaanensis]|uniref:cell wall-binding repeat-containing protein n=1 Tax=Serinicoccus kebangsaanensis TaxID=2602069 RepID=UPI00124EF3D5|nr:cell wall-binding repeat-containing protein [Serinicoccus kebangsaanensis]